MKSTKDRVYEVIRKHFGVNKSAINPTANLADDYGADSLDGIELLMTLEDEFDIEIDDEAAEKCKTVGDVMGLIEGRVVNG